MPVHLLKMSVNICQPLNRRKGCEQLAVAPPPCLCIEKGQVKPDLRLRHLRKPRPPTSSCNGTVIMLQQALKSRQWSLNRNTRGDITRVTEEINAGLHAFWTSPSGEGAALLVNIPGMQELVL